MKDKRPRSKMKDKRPRRTDQLAGHYFKDDPSLRNKESNIDKKIGSEGQRLAEKRLVAIKRAREMARSSDSGEPSLSSSSPSRTSIENPSDSNKWIQLGPNLIPNGQTYSPKGNTVNVSGRITAIVAHPTDENVIYIGAAQGGIWKSTDGGKTWSAKSDNADSLAIGALAIDESNPNVLYAGTGEGHFGWDSQYGLGVLKTIDGGESWELKAQDTFISSRFCRLVINPKKPSIIFAATTSGFTQNVASGIYRSADGGENWIRMEDGLPSLLTYGATDIVLDYNNPDIGYAAFWGEGIFKTINASAANPKWDRLSSGLPVSNFERIGLGISKSSPNILYTLMSNSQDIIDKFYHTNNGGASWKEIKIKVSPTAFGGSALNGTYDFGGQGFYNMNVAVHPQNQNIVYLSTLSLWKAVRKNNDNGWSFSNIGLEIHGDNHSFAFNPENPDIIYAGNDGGIYRSDDAGNTWADDINQGLCITQFDFMEQHPTDEKIIFAGAQDNGTILYEGTSTFQRVAPGDGGFTCIDSNQPNNVWHTYFELSPELSEEGGKLGTWIWLGEKIFGQPSNFNPPLALDKSNSNNIAIGGHILYIDHSKGQDGWPERIPFNFPDNDLISAINYVNSKLIYVGTKFGRIFRVTKQAENWKIESIHASPFPTQRYIWDIATLPNDETNLIVVVSGFGSGHVFHGSLKSNNVATWTDISGTGDGRLPDNPTNALVIDDNKQGTMYVGTDVGVFCTYDAGKKWEWFSQGLPNAQIYDMRLHSPTGLLRVVTHGRGMWERKVR
jgi:photosystem II stability/assembly factor-like uncharacterized protein